MAEKCPPFHFKAFNLWVGLGSLDSGNSNCVSNFMSARTSCSNKVHMVKKECIFFMETFILVPNKYMTGLKYISYR